MIEVKCSDMSEAIVLKTQRKINEVLSGCIQDVMQSDCLKVTKLKAIKMILERWADDV